MAWEPTKLRTWHTLLMDFFILRPEASYAEAAAHFDCHPGTISIVANTDLFKAQLAERLKRMEVEVNTAAREKLQGKVTELAETSLDILNHRLAKERTLLGLNAVPTMELSAIQETADMALKNLGFGAPKSVAPAQNSTNVIFVDRELLSSARERMRSRDVHVIENDQPAISSAS